MGKGKPRGQTPSPALDPAACERLELIIDSLDDAVFLYDAGSKTFRDCNAAAARIFGYTRDALRVIDPVMLYPEPAAAASFDAAARDALRQGDSFFAEWPLKRADGAIFPACAACAACACRLMLPRLPKPEEAAT